MGNLLRCARDSGSVAFTLACLVSHPFKGIIAIYTSTKVFLHKNILSQKSFFYKNTLLQKRLCISAIVKIRKLPRNTPTSSHYWTFTTEIWQPQTWNSKFKRYLYKQVNRDAKLLGIKGTRPLCHGCNIRDKSTEIFWKITWRRLLPLLQNQRERLSCTHWRSDTDSHKQRYCSRRGINNLCNQAKDKKAIDGHCGKHSLETQHPSTFGKPGIDPRPNPENALLVRKAALLILLTDKLKDNKHLVGPKKIYLENTNLMKASGCRISKGTQRETFFADQVGAVTSLSMPKQGDSLSNNKYLFE